MNLKQLDCGDIGKGPQVFAQVSSLTAWLDLLLLFLVFWWFLFLIFQMKVELAQLSVQGSPQDLCMSNFINNPQLRGPH